MDVIVCILLLMYREGMGDTRPVIDSSSGRRFVPLQILLSSNITLIPDRSESQPIPYSTQPFQHLIVLILDRTHLEPKRNEVNLHGWIESLRRIDHVLPYFVRFFERTDVVDIRTFLSARES